MRFEIGYIDIPMADDLFATEPVSSTYFPELMKNPDELKKFGEFLNAGSMFRTNAIEQVNGRDLIVGVSSYDKLSHYFDTMTKEHLEKYSSFPVITQLTNFAVEVEKQYIKENNIDIDLCAHSCGVGVSPRMQNKGVAISLLMNSYETMKNTGNKYIFAECTNDYSLKLAIRYDAKVIGSKKYADFEAYGYPKNQHDSYNVVVLQLFFIICV